jgi:signal transduction histidine kinase
LILKQDGNEIKFSVRDEGPGIPKEEQHLLFSEFHRLSIRPTAGETSTGLGLAITKKIMEAHGGSIEFESSEGSGAIFSLVFPLPSCNPTMSKSIT